MSAPRRYRQQSTRRAAFFPVIHHVHRAHRSRASLTGICDCESPGQAARVRNLQGPHETRADRKRFTFLPNNGMTESRRPPRRGRGRRPSNKTDADTGDNPYRDDASGAAGPETDVTTRSDSEPDVPPPRAERSSATDAEPSNPPPPAAAEPPPPSIDRQSIDRQSGEMEIPGAGNGGNGSGFPNAFRNDAGGPNGGNPARGYQQSSNIPGRDRGDRPDRGDRKSVV